MCEGWWEWRLRRPSAFAEAHVPLLSGLRQSPASRIAHPHQDRPQASIRHRHRPYQRSRAPAPFFQRTFPCQRSPGPTKAGPIQRQAPKTRPPRGNHRLWAIKGKVGGVFEIGARDSSRRVGWIRPGPPNSHSSAGGWSFSFLFKPQDSQPSGASLFLLRSLFWLQSP